VRPTEIIVTHGSTDFDALGSMLAARRLYPEAQVLVHGGLNRNVREFVTLHEAELQLADPAKCDLSDVARVIVVETSHLSRLGALAEVAQRQGVEALLFDHHGDRPPDWVDAAHAVLSDDGALSTTMVGILAERGIQPTPAEATALALGIHEDTGSLTYVSTTLRDVEALAFCARHGAAQELIARFLHLPVPEEQRALLTTLVDAAETVDVDGIGVLVTAVAWPRYVDGISTLATKVTEVVECEALLMLVEMDGRVFAVARSRSSGLDMAAGLSRLGGGGHAQAASAIVRGSPLDAVRREAVAGLHDGLVPGARAEHIMSSPAWLVDDDMPIAEALAECRKRRTSGVLVRSGERLAGVVSREDLGRAIAHGLGHAPLRGVMTAGVTAVSASASLAELRRALLTVDRVIVADRPGEDGVPVAEVRGVVTRGDLLRALRSRPEERGEAVAADDLGGLLRALPGLDRLWQAVPAAAEAQDGVYLVGGAVRDVLLGEPTFDIDLAVEGDGIAFARDLAAELGGRMHAHEKFHTAVVIAGDLRVDVATARTEHYEHPAALPIVEHSSIRQDLQRRDFTINAMAVKLQADGFGELVDPFGGAGDLRAGRVRVLHNLSFIEDPTRIFRAIRYENRYRFAMDAHTRELARACVDMGLVGDLSGARVRDELVALLSEDEVSGSVGRLAALGLAAAIHPGLDAGDEVVARVKALDAAAAAHLPAAPRWRLRLAAMAHRLPGDELLEWLERLRVRRRDARVVAALTAVAPRLADRLAGDVEPAEVGELLDAQPAEVAVAIAASGGPAGRAAELYLEQLRDLGLDVNGGTLREELGLEESPRIGTILAELLRRRRNGELGGRDEQLEAARELAEEVPS